MTAEDLLLEFVWIVKTFQNSDGMTFEALNEKWKNDHEYNEKGSELNYPNFHRHLEKLAVSLGVFISYDRRRRVYYMENKKPLRGDDLVSWLFKSVMIKNAFQQLLGLERRVSLQNISMGEHVILNVARGIRENRVLKMKYLAQRSDRVKAHTVQPYGLKMFDSRIYLIAKLNDKILPFELDRIQSLEVTSTVFDMPADFDIHDYYFHYFGVFRDENVPPEEVEIWTFDNEHRYLKELPLHHSQKEIGNGKKDYHKYKLFLSPTDDFMSKIIAQVNRIKVMKPQWLVEKLKERIGEMGKMYDMM